MMKACKLMKQASCRHPRLPPNATAEWRIFLLVLAFFGTVSIADAFSTGAGGCDGGDDPAVGNMPAVSGSHLSREKISGPFIDNEMILALNGITLMPNNFSSTGIKPKPFTFRTGVPHTLSVSSAAQEYRGILFRLSPSTILNADITDDVSSIDTAGSLIPGDPNSLQLTDVCILPVVGITHMDNSFKNNSMAILEFDIPGITLVLDVTVVVHNGERVGSEFYFDQFLLLASNWTADSDAGFNTTYPPTLAPNAVPAPTTPQPTTPGASSFGVAAIPSLRPLVAAFFLSVLSVAAVM
jgi:hypothetical protein